jgi:molybdopterin-containing oxidoreductase family membrane subunit
VKIIRFLFCCVRLVLRGSKTYYAWLAFLFVLIFLGAMGYRENLVLGHIASNMRDQVSWGFFIGTYAFLVGVAAAAVALVVPGYVYEWKPIKEIVIFGEIVAISSVVMCLLFVMADLGRPERAWHMLPLVGWLNLPQSLMGWNVLILNAYLVLNLAIVTYVLYCFFNKRPYNKKLTYGLIFLSIPSALSIHATTAFIFDVLPGRPYWNSAILVPRFIATALCSGPALMILVFQVLRKVANLRFKDEAIQKIAEIMIFVMVINLLLFLAEVIKEFRSDTEHLIHMQYYFSGLTLYALIAIACNTIAFLIFLIPRLRRKLLVLNLGCVLIILAVFIEKGIGLVHPGFAPTPFGEIYSYVPSISEWMIWFGVIGAGMLVFTVLTKITLTLVFTESK